MANAEREFNFLNVWSENYVENREELFEASLKLQTDLQEPKVTCSTWRVAS